MGYDERERGGCGRGGGGARCGWAGGGVCGDVVVEGGGLGEGGVIAGEGRELKGFGWGPGLGVLK